MPDDDEASTPDDEIDLEQWGPRTKLGLGERIKQRARTFATYGLLAIVLVGIVAAWSRQLALNLLSNPFVQAGLVLGTVWFTGLIMGIRRQRGAITRADWLILAMPEGVKPYLGEFQTADDGTKVFLPYRGFDFLGSRSRPLELRELGEEVARTYAKQGRDASDPARIRVDDATVQYKDTAYGTVVAVITDGLEVDGFGRYSDVYCAPPSQVTEENYRQLREQLDMYTSKIVPRLKNRITALQQERDNLEELATEKREAVREEMVQTHTRLKVATDGRRKPRDGMGDPAANGQGDDWTIKELEDYLEELEA